MDIQSLIAELKKIWDKKLTNHPFCLTDGIKNQSILYLSKITKVFFDKKLHDDHFVKEILSGDRDRYYQRLSEIIVADILLKDGFELKSSSIGPDFLAFKKGTPVYFEVITPKMSIGIVDPLSRVKFAVCKKNDFLPSLRAPHSIIQHLFMKAADHYDISSGCWFSPEFEHELILSFTSALKEKKEKFQDYIEKNILEFPEAPKIIVINPYLSCPEEYSYRAIMDENNLNVARDYLHAVEKSFLGKDAIFTPNKGIQTFNNTFIKNHNNSPIHVDGFVNKQNIIISALIITTVGEEYALSKILFKEGIKNTKKFVPKTVIYPKYKDAVLQPESKEAFESLNKNKQIEYLQLYHYLKRLAQGPLVVFNSGTRYPVDRAVFGNFLFKEASV